MKLKQKLIDEIDDFLEFLPSQDLQGGRQYFSAGHVVELQCITPNKHYSAIVNGGKPGKPYEVGIERDTYGWMGECTCPEEIDCKHVVAAILKLRQLATADDSPASGPGRRKGKQPAAPQAPRTPLEARLVEHFRSNLPQSVREFYATISAIHEKARHSNLNEYDLSQISSSAHPGYGSWKHLEIWPDFPKNDYELWLYLAWEIRRRGIPLPILIEPITDFSLIEERMRQFERTREIAWWNSWFQTHEPAGAGLPSDPSQLEVRLAIFPAEARLQWRFHPDAHFAELKRTQARKLAEQFANGELTIAPGSLPLWSAVYKPWDYENWWSFKYAHSTAHPGLNRLLRLPVEPACLVNADGRPLERPTEPLRLDLATPDRPDGDYELALTTAAGDPPPVFLCILPGRPTLYLTESTLYHGPPADALLNHARRTIPAPALETARGLRFLHSTGVPLPAALQERVTVVPVRVTVSCKLKPTYPGSKTEDIAINISATAPDFPEEYFGFDSWQGKSYSPKKAGSENGGLLIHDREAQRHFPRLLESLGPKWDTFASAWKLRLTKKTPDLLIPWFQSMPPDVELHLDPELATLRDDPVSGKVSLDVAEAGIDWFDLKVVIDAGDTEFTPEELKLLLNAKGGYVRLGSKGWRRLQFDITPEEDEQLARLGLNPSDFSAEPQRFHALQLADHAAKRFLGPDRVEAIQRRVSDLKTRVSPPLPDAIRAEMRPYQTDGFHFLAYLTSNSFGGVLADDMGLGKTLQTLAWLAWLRETAPAQDGPPAPSLVVCPKSVMDNWHTEAARFYPGLRVRLWAGQPVGELAAAREDADLIVLNYPQLRSLSPEIASVQWFAAILDEAQYIKNPDSQTAQVARSIKAFHRLALTGTPIENRLLDLWSIFGFAMPGILGNRTHFLRRFDAKDDPLARRRLAARVRPFLLRRTKNQVAQDLPDRVEEDLLCELEGEQQTLYRAELKRARQMLLGLGSTQDLNKERFNILTSLLRLRQICCHPALVDKSLEDAASAKLAALEELLEPLVEEGHKVLVFSQFVTMLDLIRKKMEERAWPYFFLAGDTENRGDLVRNFQSAEGAAVFLISLKAGGFGLNLTAASYVVLFDPWWNPAVENQAIDRTHRIGQTSKVIAYRLLIRDTVEQKIRALQKQKGALADDVLGEERFAQSLTLDDLHFLFAE